MKKVNITTIKTFEDAMNAAGLTTDTLPELLKPEYEAIVPLRIKALLKLEIIAFVLNQGIIYKPKHRTYAWYPWFFFLTEEKMKEWSRNERVFIKFKRGQASKKYAGLGSASSSYAWSRSLAAFGSRLACLEKDTATYFGKQFIELWRDYLYA